MTYYETPEPQRKRALMNRAKPPTRAERREQTRQAVEELIQAAYQTAGGQGDAGAVVLRGRTIDRTV